MEKYLDSAKETYRIAKEYFLYTSFQDLRPLLVGEVLKRAGTLFSLLTTPIMTFAKRYTKDPRIQQVLGYPAVFLGSSPYLAPSMFHLMSHLDLEDGVLYADGGFTKVIDSMAEVIEANGVTVVLGARVGKILTQAGGKKARATGVEYVDRAGKTIVLEADMVVSTTDLHHSETTMLPKDLQTYPQSWWDKKTVGPSAVLLYLGVKGDVPELEHHTLFFTKDWEDNFTKIFQDPPVLPTLPRCMSVSPARPMMPLRRRGTPIFCSRSHASGCFLR
jgi:1-hydroxy-2-isopentenylcarotenoid 3,4-desaturase